MRRLSLLLAALALAACSADTDRIKSDWEVENAGRLAKQTEASEQVALPPFPRRENLVEFFFDPTNGFRFSIDRTSLSVASDFIVRYVMVGESSSGVRNVTYEGINCRQGEYIVYAGGANGEWVSRGAAWREVGDKAVQRWRSTLLRDYFCPNRIAIASAEEGVMALERGGHPLRASPNL